MGEAFFVRERDLHLGAERAILLLASPQEVI